MSLFQLSVPTEKLISAAKNIGGWTRRAVGHRIEAYKRDRLAKVLATYYKELFPSSFNLYSLEFEGMMKGMGSILNPEDFDQCMAVEVSSVKFCASMAKACGEGFTEEIVAIMNQSRSKEVERLLSGDQGYERKRWHEVLPDTGVVDGILVPIMTEFDDAVDVLEKVLDTGAKTRTTLDEQFVNFCRAGVVIGHVLAGNNYIHPVVMWKNKEETHCLIMKAGVTFKYTSSNESVWRCPHTYETDERKSLIPGDGIVELERALQLDTIEQKVVGVASISHEWLVSSGVEVFKIYIRERMLMSWAHSILDEITGDLLDIRSDDIDRGAKCWLACYSKMREESSGAAGFEIPNKEEIREVMVTGQSVAGSEKYAFMPLPCGQEPAMPMTARIADTYANAAEMNICASRELILDRLRQVISKAYRYKDATLRPSSVAELAWARVSNLRNKTKQAKLPAGLEKDLPLNRPFHARTDGARMVGFPMSNGILATLNPESTAHVEYPRPNILAEEYYEVLGATSVKVAILEDAGDISKLEAQVRKVISNDISKLPALEKLVDVYFKRFIQMKTESLRAEEIYGRILELTLGEPSERREWLFKRMIEDLAYLDVSCRRSDSLYRCYFETIRGLGVGRNGSCEVIFDRKVQINRARGAGTGRRAVLQTNLQTGSVYLDVREELLETIEHHIVGGVSHAYSGPFVADVDTCDLNPGRVPQYISATLG